MPGPHEGRGKLLGLQGNEAIAYAVKQADVDVIAAYPITPQTIIVERLAEYVHNGELDAEFVAVESEHSALSTVIGAAAAGARVFTATASQGLALMHEIVHIASSGRYPVVMAIVSRALSAPINIHCDHSDIYTVRDTGWIILFAENPQEAYDSTIMAFRIAEDPELLLPVIVDIDGFIVSHALEPVRVLEDEEVRKFLPRRKRPYVLDPDNPVTFGPLALPDYYMEIRRQLYEATNVIAPRKIREVAEEYEKLSGRRYRPVETYFTDDADIVIVSLGSVTGTVRHVVKEMRKEGAKVGCIKIWQYRPFPEEEIAKALEDKKLVIVMDRAAPYGGVAAPLFQDIAATFINRDRVPPMIDIIYGLGGRDVPPSQVRDIIKMGLDIVARGEKPEKKVIWVGVRE